MGDRKAALAELIEKVDAGDQTRSAIEDAGMQVWPDGKDHFLFVYAASAYSGSLDAALALHEAVLPGWGWHIWAAYGHVLHPNYAVSPGGATTNDTPARAFLLAILKALHAQETGQ